MHWNSIYSKYYWTLSDSRHIFGLLHVFLRLVKTFIVRIFTGQSTTSPSNNSVSENVIPLVGTGCMWVWFKNEFTQWPLYIPSYRTANGFIQAKRQSKMLIRLAYILNELFFPLILFHLNLSNKFKLQVNSNDITSTNFRTNNSIWSLSFEINLETVEYSNHCVFYQHMV